jgi:uncharacterized membrane protein YczE
MDKKIKKKILKIADELLSFNPLFVFSNLLYGGVIAILFSLIFMGIRLQLLEGYFQYMIFAVMLVFCIREADRHFSKLSGLWLVVGMGVFVHYVLAMVGHNTTILSAMIKFAVFIVVTSIIYHLGFRKYLIKKLGLTKREVLELKQNQK